MAIPFDLQLAYQRGAEAYREGLPVTSNPYLLNPKRAVSWRRGWERAEKDDIAETARQ